ncbi:amidohydrolase family protein [Microbispora rosea]|uniref:amidohydrolase family protein n=1 Tax=Microbispora rosea TaxID=58117 RepID=UPI00194F10F8|nr:amidohydrolase family protein [Microbispora rosea]
MPGFNDAHHHLSMRGQRLRELDLRDGQVGTLDEVYAKVAERAAGLPQDAWVKGAGYDQNKLGGLHPSREALVGRPAAGPTGCSPNRPRAWRTPCCARCRSRTSSRASRWLAGRRPVRA